ncbi:uncharacterized protein LOC126855979 [Cataglyphis hispanica]|uniref:uncharacterized protein LOC126855979 n=1 Tax=Cataglyphis hispanica TaxID=1086592 RepID=UPI0021804B80|nr:uncharacterized protein LOC126855979 [Cataglyphis hispanica]
MKITTLKGIFPDPKPIRRKNFIQENVKNLRRMEQCFQANKEIEELQKLELQKHHKATDRYHNISARVATTFRERKKQKNNHISSMSKTNVQLKTNNSASTDKVEDEVQIQNENNTLGLDKKNTVPAKKIIRQRINNNNNISDRQKKTSKHDKNQQKMEPKVSKPDVLLKSEDNTNEQITVKYINRGIQTLDTDEVESIYSEGVIRYPSKKVTKHNETASNGDLNQQDEKTLKNQINSPTDRGDMRNLQDVQNVDLQNSVSPAPKEEIDFIKLNKERTSIATKLAIQLNNGVPLPNYRKGVIPKYLRVRKEAQEKEQKIKAEAQHPDCPEGHVPIPDHERKETLRLLKKNYQDYVNELNMMPIKTDTLRAQRRKIEIEKQLNKLEEGIKVFSRPKVYVKINA